jgi:hypothetical protein
MLSTWNKALLSALALLPALLGAQTPGGAEGSWQHADGVFWGWQRVKPDDAQHSFFLVDNGNVQLTRTVPARSHVARLNWTLGVGDGLDRFLLLEGRSIWERTVGQHRFSLGIDAGGSAFFGSIRFANLEDQFLLSSGLELSASDGLTDRWGTGITIGDSIALSQTLDLILDASRQKSQVRILGDAQSQSEIDSWGARLEKRWVIARLQASARKTELDLDNAQQADALAVRQNVLDMQARLLFPLFGRLNGSIGWQDLRSAGINTEDRQLSGPELGLAYTPQSALSASIFLRALEEKNNDASEGQVFGETNIAYRGDARNSFLLSLSKQIDLTTSYRVFIVQNFATTDQQLSTVTGQAQWAHQRGRYGLTLALVQSRQEFALSDADFTEANIIQIYDVTRRGQLSLALGGRFSRFETDAPPVSIRRYFADVRIGWQQMLIGGLRPLGGRAFYRVDFSYEHLQEKITDVAAERLTLLLSLGQLGNF